VSVGVGVGVEEKPVLPVANGTVVSPSMSEVQKWEKVKKKNRQKNSEKDVATPLENGAAKKVVVGAFFSDKDIKKYEVEKEKRIVKEEPKTGLVNSFSLKDLIDKGNQSKNAEETKGSPVKTPVAAAAAAWGGTVSVINSKHTLLDVMNEEMTKVLQIRPINEVKLAINSPPKGWNVFSQQNKLKSPPQTLTQILEIERKNNEDFKKLTNRNMDMIQQEEKAIEDLRKLYNVNDSSDMRITIEVFNETSEHFSHFKPVWRK